MKLLVLNLAAAVLVQPRKEQRHISIAYLLTAQPQRFAHLPPRHFAVAGDIPFAEQVRYALPVSLQ